MKLGKTLVLLLFITLEVGFVVPKIQAAPNYPDPVGYVNDFAGILKDSTIKDLEQKIAALEKESGAEIAVVTIKSLEGETVDEYAVRLFEKWKVGKKDRDNGVMLLVAKDERKVRIEVGYGLESIITDGRAGEIIRTEIAPNFKKDDYDTGVERGVAKISEDIRSGTPPSPQETETKASEDFPPVVFLAFIGLIYTSSFLARTKRFWPGGIVGAVLGLITGLVIGSLLAKIFMTIVFCLMGFAFDYILSRNYKKLKKAGKPTGFFGSYGGFSSGGGGFGGFGGGSSGGGGASGGW